MKRLLFIALAAASLLTGPAPGEAAQAPEAAPVYCGSFTPIQFRVAAFGRDAGSRALFAMDIINKFLGGKVGKFTAKPEGKRIRLLLNNEHFAFVTAEDAAAEREKTPAALAAKWVKKLTLAFDASKAQPG